MRKEELLYLADEVEAMAADAFNFANWRLKQRCGTTRCAAGLACTLERFQRLGLHASAFVGVPICTDANGLPVTGFRAMAAVFRISESDALYLFHARDSGLGERATTKQVADHIRAFVARGGQPSVLPAPPPARELDPIT